MPISLDATLNPTYPDWLLPAWLVAVLVVAILALIFQRSNKGATAAS